MGWQEPSPGAAPSKGLTFHNLFTNENDLCGGIRDCFFVF